MTMSGTPAALPSVQLITLRALRLARQPLPLATLAAETETTPSYVAQTLNKLRAESLAQVASDDGGRRLYTITNAGDQRLRGHFAVMRALDVYGDAQPNGHQASRAQSKPSVPTPGTVTGGWREA